MLTQGHSTVQYSMILRNYLEEAVKTISISIGNACIDFPVVYDEQLGRGQGTAIFHTM